MLAAGVDSGDDRRGVRVRARPEVPRVFALKGEEGRGGRPLVTRRAKAKDRRPVNFLVNVEVAKDVRFRRLSIQKSGGSYIHFPATQQNGGLGDDFLAQFANEKQIRKKRPDGQYDRYYARTGPNEAVDLHAHNYAAL